MIYSYKNDKSLHYTTPLIEYIKKNNLYEKENLIYTKKYTDGTFSITTPSDRYINCKQINGYPHFSIPLDIILEEILYFIDDCNMYNNSIIIRYGDMHPHNPIPKLAQVRNLIINKCLNSMIGKCAESKFAIGDISIKSLNNFVKKYNLNISGEKLFVDIVNDKINDELKFFLNQFDFNAMSKIKKFLENLRISENTFILESNLYSEQEFYQQLKNDPKFKNNLKANGELKYTLQEIIFIHSLLKKHNDTLINIIGSNQSEHIKKVNNILTEMNEDYDVRFLSYGICRNGDSNDYNKWNSEIFDYIERNNLTQLSNLMEVNNFLDALTITNSNDTILDFNNLNKYAKNIIRFNKLIDSIFLIENNNVEISKCNDLLCQMALVGYYLNKSIENGNQNMFYRYILSIVDEYERNVEKYKNMSGLYCEFISQALKRIGYPMYDEKNKIKRLVIR